MSVAPGLAAGRSDTARPAADVVGLVVVPALTALAIGAAAWPWRRGLEVSGATAGLVVASVAPVVVSLLLVRVLRQPAVSSYAASVIGLVVVVAAVSGLHPSAIAGALAHEPARLLTETLPLTGSATMLVVPVTVVWIGATATAETLSRTRRSQAGLAVPVISYLIAFGATAGAPHRDDASGGWLLVALALLSLARRRETERRTPRDDQRDAAPAGDRRRGRRGVIGAGVAIVVAAGLAAGIPRLQPLSGAQASLRRLPVTTAAVVVDPVDAIESIRDGDPSAAPTPLFTLTTSRSSTGYLGVAILDDYDGDTWTFDTTFEPTGGRVPPGSAGQPGSVTGRGVGFVDQRYRLVAGYPLPFVPTLDRPTEVSGLSVDADPDDGAVVPASTLVAPVTYGVVSHTPDVTLAGLGAADSFERTPTDAADLAVPAGADRATAALGRFETTVTGLRPTRTVAFLRALVAALRADEHRLQPAAGARTAPSHGGTALAEVVQAVTVDRVATPEQYATFVAVAARELGIPARLVTGFRATPAASSRPLPSGTTTVTDREAWTWAEVPVVGAGWVVVDATPTSTATGSTPPPPDAAVTPTTLAPPLANAVPIQGGPGGSRAVAPRSRIVVAGQQGDRGAWRRDLPIALVVLLVVAGAGPALTGARRALRRRGRRSADPAALAIGAWLELLDGLETAGLPITRHATSAEVVRAATAAFGEETVAGAAVVAATAERAVCSPADPPDRVSARAGWDLQRQIGGRLRRSLPPRRRLRSLVRVGHQPRRPVGDAGPIRRRRAGRQRQPGTL